MYASHEPGSSVAEQASGIRPPLPAVALAEPAVALTEPAVALTEPAVALTEPAVALTEPAVALTEPAIELAPPTDIAPAADVPPALPPGASMIAVPPHAAAKPIAAITAINPPRRKLGRPPRCTIAGGLAWSRGRPSSAQGEIHAERAAALFMARRLGSSRVTLRGGLGVPRGRPRTCPGTWSRRFDSRTAAPRS